MGTKPILDQIEFGMDRGILVIIALVVTVITLAMIVKVVLTVIEIVKTAKIQKEITTYSSSSSKENFSYNLIEEDIASLNIQLSNEAKKLLSTYRD